MEAFSKSKDANVYRIVPPDPGGYQWLFILSQNGERRWCFPHWKDASPDDIWCIKCSKWHGYPGYNEYYNCWGRPPAVYFKLWRTLKNTETKLWK